MAEHPGDQGAIRRLQDGNVLEVGSTGTVRVFGNLKLGSSGSSGSTGKTKVTQAVAFAGSGYAAQQVQTKNNAVSTTKGSTGFVALSGLGLSILSATGSTVGLVGFRLPHPVAAGVRKQIFAKECSTGVGVAVVETTSKDVHFGTTSSTAHSGYHRLTLNAREEAVELIGLSTGAWGVISNVGSVALSTNFTT